MLRSADELKGYALEGSDGEIGRCNDFLFDDEFWTIRYMVADTGKWLPGRKVLVSPISLGEPEWASRRFPVNLTKKQIEEAPGLDHDAPVSRQYEARWFSHYHYPFYWGGDEPWGAGIEPRALATATAESDQSKGEARPGDPHLRSVEEVIGYHIEATDGGIGHVEDFILDDHTWALRYMVVDTRNWLPGRRVLIAPTWVKAVEWSGEKAKIDLTREEVRNSPEYDPSTPANREYEVRLYDFYGRPKYWE
jgi:hypothetical protein